MHDNLIKNGGGILDSTAVIVVYASARIEISY